MNFILVSPNFPETFRWFAIRLKENGVNVLGLGDAPYDELHSDLREALTEYYRLDDLGDYDAMVRAVGYFTFRYGKIDWIESNNEYWLEMDAALRTAFNITTGPKSAEIHGWKSKLAMKETYQQAGIPCARCIPVTTRRAAFAFVKEVGYPVVVKPDNGVGANATYRLEQDADVENFFAALPQVPYVMEEYVPGVVTTYDGICDSQGKVLFAVSHITPNSIMDMVNKGVPTYYYINDHVPADVEQIGRKALQAFGVTRRFFHLEFFRLTQNKPGLGSKGTLLGLEVNMRPAGGFTTEMINYGQSVDVYQIYADMVAHDTSRHTYIGPKRFCVYVGRRTQVRYAYSLEQLCISCGEHLCRVGKMPPALAGAMGDEWMICCYDKKPEIDQFVRKAFLLPHKVKR
ncbi:ATP-grasp domain-containing protein [Subdoligranulum variabile]|uniref:ATP-grasp domain protein n=1 Tax=Subdoligranulum variabile DSM 15176 TaxID=411471 RepID=D1PKL4_9FIRM|nr:ATP-grasp domain-containing protein [Subdoligranulum variabile]EFB76522.1 ATP-grasp domain protein [Subdoligranulum variabile DSM 15176]UWP68240.1 ATP-grasp domain-containing protein [Subdoligranulum variabile]